MAAELVETNRLWARRVAQIDPAWAERVGEHLVRRSYGEARWARDRPSPSTASTRRSPERC
jgi:ATP-dependent helicase HrpA